MWVWSLGRSPAGGHGDLLQYSCLRNSLERGAWWPTVYGVARSRTRLKQLTHTLLGTMMEPAPGSWVEPVWCTLVRVHPPLLLWLWAETTHLSSFFSVALNISQRDHKLIHPPATYRHSTEPSGFLPRLLTLPCHSAPFSSCPSSPSSVGVSEWVARAQTWCLVCDSFAPGDSE